MNVSHEKLTVECKLDFFFINPRMAHFHTEVDLIYEEKEPLWSRWLYHCTVMTAMNEKPITIITTPQHSRGEKCARLSLFAYNNWWANREKKKRRKADEWIKEVSIEILLFYYFFFIFRSSFLPSTNTTPSTTSLTFNLFFLSTYCLCRSFNWFCDWIDYYYYSRQNILFVERSDGFDTRSSHIIVSSSVVITPIVRI